MQLFEGNHSFATLAHGEEVKHRTGFTRIVMQCPHSYLADKRQCALTTHHAVCYDVKRVVVGDERTQVQARHVLDAVFLADAISQRLIGADAVTQGFNASDEVRMSFPE